jgi:hypothetical protein
MSQTPTGDRTAGHIRHILLFQPGLRELESASSILSAGLQGGAEDA